MWIYVSYPPPRLPLCFRLVLELKNVSQGMRQLPHPTFWTTLFKSRSVVYCKSDTSKELQELRLAVGALLNNWQSWEFRKILRWKIFHILFLIFPNLDWVWRRTFCGLTGLLSKLTRKVTKSVQTSYQSTHNTKNRTDPLVIPKSSIRLSCIVVIFTEVNSGISTKTFI